MNLRIHNNHRHKDKQEKQKSIESTQINCKFCDFRNGMRALVAHMNKIEGKIVNFHKYCSTFVNSLLL